MSEKNHDGTSQPVLFVNFAAFPDFTLTIFDDLISFEENAVKRIQVYYKLLEVYAAAKRPDLGFTALLNLSNLLEQENHWKEAILALATTIQKCAEEGLYVPKMLNRLESLALDTGGADQTLAEFHQNFLPKIPQTRGDSPGEYCIQMYDRAAPIFKRVGQTQLAQSKCAGAAQLHAGQPK